MLIDTQYLIKTRRLVISYVDKTGDIKLKYYDWQDPFKYVVCDNDDPDKHPIYHSWDGKSIKKIVVNHPDRYSIYEFLESLPENEKEEIFAYNTPNIYFIDIEVKVSDGFPEAEEAPNEILSISIVFEDKIILLGMKDLSIESQEKIKSDTNEYFKSFGKIYKLKYIKYDDEFDMLYSFFYKMVPKMPLLTGWNFIGFDWTYLVNRSRKLSKFINGKEIKIDPSISSLTRRMSKVWMKNYEIPAHRMVFDYMQLYEIADTTIKVKESSSLDFVSNKLVGVDKIKYHGSLQRLYEQNFEMFMYYNTVDSVLVQKIHESRNYISIIFAISSLARIKVVDVISQMNNALGSLAITEGVLRNKFREQDNVILFKQEKVENNESAISGGWVKDPIEGMNLWCTTYDFESLYPKSQLQFYISPENFIGMKDNKSEGKCTNGRNIEDNHVVLVNGAVFNKRRSPTIRMLEDVSIDRKKNKKIMLSKKEELKEILEEIYRLESEL